jgi:hypothetical protein
MQKGEAMDDLISRQAAIDALEDAGMTNYLATGEFYGIVNATTVIKNMPTAEPRRGEWLDRYGDMECSCCGFSCDDPYYLGEANYCPNCGAKMMEESDE